MDNIITTAQAAEILGTCERWVGELVRKCKITLTEQSVIAYRDGAKNKGGRPKGSIALKPKWQVIDSTGKPIADCYFPSDAKALAGTNPNYIIIEKPSK